MESGYIRFQTKGASDSNIAERMRITSSGNLGLGTSSPNEKLTISSGAISFLGEISTPSIGAGLFRPANNTLAVVTGSNERLRIKSNGSVHIANTNVTGDSGDNGVSFDTNGRMVSNADNDWNFEIYGARQGRLRFFSSAGGSGTQVGSITTGTGSTAYNTSSDYRLKENVTYDFDAKLSKHLSLIHI